MRIDKFLKTSLIFKTRSSAEKAINNGHILLNNNKTKTSAKVKVGDIIYISFPLKKVEYEILELKEGNVTRKDAREMIRVIKEEKIEI